MAYSEYKVCAIVQDWAGFGSSILWLVVSWWYLWVYDRRWMGISLTDGFLKVRAEKSWRGGHAL